jgi:hypothetical protein
MHGMAGRLNLAFWGIDLALELLGILNVKNVHMCVGVFRYFPGAIYATLSGIPFSQLPPEGSHR